MRRTRSRHFGRSVRSGATTPNRNGLVMPGLLSTNSVSVPGEGVLGQDRVDLANGPRSAFVRARGQDPLHGLDAWEATLDRHARTPDVDLLDRDTRRGQRRAPVWA